MEAAIDVVFGPCVRLIVRDKAVTLCDPGLDRSRKISPKAVVYDIFDSFVATTSERKSQLILGQNVLEVYELLTL